MTIDTKSFVKRQMIPLATQEVHARYTATQIETKIQGKSYSSVDKSGKFYKFSVCLTLS